MKSCPEAANYAKQLEQNVSFYFVKPLGYGNCYRDDC